VISDVDALRCDSQPSPPPPSSPYRILVPLGKRAELPIDDLFSGVAEYFLGSGIERMILPSPSTAIIALFAVSTKLL
jgi:hypothetical protein